jgi:hypothetical protein
VEIGQSVIVSLTVADVLPFSPTYPDTPSGTYTVSNIFNTGDDVFIQVTEHVILSFGYFAGGSITVVG